MLDKVLGLFDAKLDSVFLNLLVVGLDPLKIFHDLLRHYGLRELKHLVKTLIAQDGHNPRNNEALYAGCTAVVHPLIEHTILKEQLSDDKVSSRLDLLLEELDIGTPRRGTQMDLGVASYTDTEVVTILFFNEADQVDGIIKPILIVHPIVSTSWWVTPQRQDVSDAEILRPVQALDNLLAVHEAASHVHHDV